MDQYGKIFVVVAVLAVILIGIFIYLFVIDRKVRKLEEDCQDRQKRQKAGEKL
jgi:CcmD family protein